MNHAERQEKLEDFYARALSILRSKGKDYTSNDDAFYNFNQLAKEINSTPEKVLWVFLQKHLISITNYIQHGRLESEPIKDRLIDASNYFALLAVMIENKKTPADSLRKMTDKVLKGKSADVEIFDDCVNDEDVHHCK